MAADLAAHLGRILPGFGSYLDSPDNLFDRDTPFAVFAAASSFVRERPLPVETWPSLASFINSLVVGGDEPLAEAACTCFLENLADRNHPIRPFLEGPAL